MPRGWAKLAVMHLLSAFVILSPGCAADCERRGIDGPGDVSCRVDGWPGRDVRVHTPTDWDGATSLALVVARHGHGGTGDGFNRTTCEEGDTDGENCLDRVADEEGFAVAYPDGTGGFLGLGRSWNAGGGGDGLRCVGDPACEDGVDDSAYDDDLFALMVAVLPIDTTRVYATGMSNGAAMSHRLACERSDRYAAIVSVAGGNQASGYPGCTPTIPVPVLHIHGTDDRCWGDDGSVGETCAGDDAAGFVSVADSMDFWAGTNGCAGEPVEEALPDAADDGQSATRLVWPGCAAATQYLRVEGGGHTWPGGWQYLSVEKIGPVTMDFSASREAWSFMKDQPAR